MGIFQTRLKKLHYTFNKLNWHHRILLLSSLLIFAVIILATVANRSPHTYKNRAAEMERKELPTPQIPEYAPGEVIVKFRQPLTIKSKAGQLMTADLDKTQINIDQIDQSSLPPSIQSISKQYKVKTIEKVFKGAQDPQTELNKLKSNFPTRKINEKELLNINLANTYKFTFDYSVDVNQIIQDLIQSPDIAYAELNYKVFTQIVPNDPYYLDSYPANLIYRDPKWNPSYDYQWNLKKINIEQAWNITTGNDSIIAAVIDTGVDCDHPEMIGHCIPGFDFVNNDTDPSDDGGHGTHVAGLIVGNSNNKSGIASPAWRGKILPIKALDNTGTGLVTTVAMGIRYATDNDAQIINMSIGNRDPFTPIPSAYKDALDYAYYHNVVLIAAAGNSGQLHRGCKNGYWPADYRFVIEVAASTQNDYPASYSNCSKDVAAPGGNSSDIVSLASHLYNYNPEYRINDQYFRMAGTSMAAPQVAGVALLILSKYPNYTNEEVRAVIKMGTDSMWNSIYGSGRINAYQALTQIAPVIALLTKPAEEDIVISPILIEGLFKNTTLGKYQYLYLLDGWKNTTHDGNTTFHNEGLTLTYPTGDNYQGVIANWNPINYPDGKYTVYLNTLGGYEDFMHIYLKKLSPTLSFTPTPTFFPTFTPTPTNTPPKFIKVLTNPQLPKIGENTSIVAEAYDPDNNDTITGKISITTPNNSIVPLPFNPRSKGFNVWEAVATYKPQTVGKYDLSIEMSDSANNKVTTKSSFNIVVPTTPTPTPPPEGICQCDIKQVVVNKCAISYVPSCTGKFSCACLKPSPTPIPIKKPTPTPTNSPPIITTTSLPIGSVKRFYSYKVSGNDGDISNNLTMYASGLPRGISLRNCYQSVVNNKKTIFCTLSGIPTNGGTFTIKFSLTDGKTWASKSLKLTIGGSSITIQ